MTTCETPDSVVAFNCQRYEQCDDCFMVDHLEECAWCEHYDHPRKTSIFKYIGLARTLRAYIETLLEKGINGI